MDNGLDPLEILWDALLSRRPEQIRLAYSALAQDEKKAVLTHLERMAVEPGWHPEQVLSAKAALTAIKEMGGQNANTPKD
jgi:hypothetical protein